MADKFVVGKRAQDLDIKAWLRSVEVSRLDGTILATDIVSVEKRLAEIMVEKCPTFSLSIRIGKSIEKIIDELARQSFAQLVDEMKSQSNRTVNYTE